MLNKTPEQSPVPHREDGIRTVTDRTFESLVLGARGPVVVEFMSYGCAHCRTIEPVLQQVAEIVKSKERIFRVNTATEKELARRYDVEATPTFVMFSAGIEVGRVEGPRPAVSSLLAAVTEAFES
jgi:thioredoxin 1